MKKKVFTSIVMKILMKFDVKLFVILCYDVLRGSKLFLYLKSSFFVSSIPASTSSSGLLLPLFSLVECISAVSSKLANHVFQH